MMPAHSLFTWIVYSAWSLGFLVTSIAIRYALIEAIGDWRVAQERKLNGALMIEAVRAIRLEVVRLAVASAFTALGVWALLSPDSATPSTQGRVTLIGFLAIGALVCSQTWFDRVDRQRQMHYRRPH